MKTDRRTAIKVIGASVVAPMVPFVPNVLPAKSIAPEPIQSDLRADWTEERYLLDAHREWVVRKSPTCQWKFTKHIFLDYLIGSLAEMDNPLTMVHFNPQLPEDFPKRPEYFEVSIETSERALPRTEAIKVNDEEYVVLDAKNAGINIRTLGNGDFTIEVDDLDDPENQFFLKTRRWNPRYHSVSYLSEFCAEEAEEVSKGLSFYIYKVKSALPYNKLITAPGTPIQDFCDIFDVQKTELVLKKASLLFCPPRKIV